MKLKKNHFILVLLLFISIGFAVLTSNLSINGIASFTDASFDVHFENAKVEDKNIDDGSITINSGAVSITSTGTFDKPGDYINTSFYVMNSGTMDSTLNTLSVSGLSNALKTYFDYTLTYDIGGTNVSRGDILRAGQGRKINLHIEYKYDVEELSTVSNLNITITMNYINPKKVSTDTVWNYEYTGGEQYFIVNKSGNYKLEVWGAQGGLKGSYIYGYGGYSVGTIALEKNQKLYINVGGSGNVASINDDFCGSEESDFCQGGYNGGGNSHFNNRGQWGSGGGATHIAIVTGLLSELSPNTNGVGSIIIVAGGGGGIYNSSGAGYGGGYIGNMGNTRTDFTTSIGGSQTSGGTGFADGSFGQGGSCPNRNCSGGGGGYYGGAGGYGLGGAGGSGYIGNLSLTDKIMYCYNCQSSVNETDETHIKTRSTTNKSATATSNYAKMGDGFVKITYLGN